MARCVKSLKSLRFGLGTWGARGLCAQRCAKGKEANVNESHLSERAAEEWTGAFRALMLVLSADQGFGLVRALHAACIEYGCVPRPNAREDWIGLPALTADKNNVLAIHALSVYHAASAAFSWACPEY
jgi:hypothetical protein